MELGVRPFAERPPIPNVAGNGPQVRLPSDAGSRRVQETGDRQCLSMPRLLSCFLFYLFVLFCVVLYYGLLSQLTEVAFSFGEIISKIILSYCYYHYLPTGLFHLPGMAWFYIIECAWCFGGLLLFSRACGARIMQFPSC